jgi:hypothetical protein
VRVEIVDEARDEAESYPVLSIKREGDAIVIVTPSLTILVTDADQVLTQAVDLL